MTKVPNFYSSATVMTVMRTIKPGHNGSKKLKAIFGRSLVAVRYRYDDKREMRYKTIEVIIDKGPIRKWKRRKWKKK